MIQAECIFIFRHELLTLAFPLDGCQLVSNRLSVCVKLHHAKKFLQLLHAVRFVRQGAFQNVNAVTQRRYTLLQLFRRCQIVLHEIIANLIELFEISNFRFPAPCPCATVGVILAEQLRQIGCLRFGQFLMRFFQPVKQRRNFLFQFADQGIGRLDPAVKFAFIGTDASGFHLADRRTLMDSRQLLHTLTLVAAVVDAAFQTLFRKSSIAHCRPLFPPMFQRFRFAPVRGGNSVEHIVSCFIPYALPIFIHEIFPPLLVAPFSIGQQGTDGTHDMKMRVGNAAVLLVGGVNGEIHHHAPAHKLLQ